MAASSRFLPGDRLPGGAGGGADIDEQRLARDVAALFGTQEDNGSIHVVALAGAIEGDAAAEAGHPRVIFIEHLFGAEPARGPGS